MMPDYPILCYTPGCGQRALCKIAARWSDGVTEELKTYALSCPDCLRTWFVRSREKQAACRKAKGEILETPGILELVPGKLSRNLARRADLEEQFR